VRRLVVVICSCLALAGLATQAAVGGSDASTSEAAKVRAQLLYEVGLFNQARWQQLWQTYTPRVRRGCSYRGFVAGMKSIRAHYGRATVRNVTVRVRGQRASVLYQIIAHGKVAGGATAKNPDIFARIGSRWFDDVDPDGLCP
jgi:hypothetical protein